MPDRGGQQLGNYHLIGLLGEGSFARVYLGEHIYLGTQSAIKVLYTRLTSQEIEDFRIEARTIANLAHPNIVRVFDFGLEEGTPFLVMDYAPFGTLRQRHVKGVALPLTTIVSYVKQVAAALQYAHDNKLIHRDVKPENMLFGKHKEVLLSDFGIAIVTQSSRYQSTQNIMGTISYMAPEQIQGKPRPASDQYSLGVVVYEWLSGERPFQGSFTEVVAQHMAVPPPPLHEKVPTISPDVEQVVLKALAKDPQQRFPAVHTFAIALEQASGQTFAHPSTPLDLPFHSHVEPIPSDQPLLPINTLPAASQPLQTGEETILPISPAQTIPPARSDRSFPVSPIQRTPRAKKTFGIALSVIVLMLLFVLVASGALINRNIQSSYTVSSTLSPSPSTAALAQAQTPAPTATPTPVPTPIPTFTPIPAQAPLPTPVPTPTPTPSPIPPPTTGSTIHLTQCGGTAPPPWVALYQYSNFGGQQICFSGIGSINLADFGFDKKTEAINIAANGVFFSQRQGNGSQLQFYYDDRQADLGNWDNQISSFTVYS